MSYDTYIFAFNNTLFDTRKGYEASYKKVFDSFGIAYDPAKYRQYFETPLHIIFESNFPEHPCKYREFVAEFYKEADKKVIGTAIPYSDTVDVIKRLTGSGKNIAIVSSSPKAYIENILKNNGMEDLFKVIIGFEGSMVQKPDPYSINVCIKKLGAEKKNCVYIGGNLTDIEAAKRAGIGKIFVDRMKNRELVDADMIISDLTELTL